jgi:hypothetical protein
MNVMNVFLKVYMILSSPKAVEQNPDRGQGNDSYFRRQFSDI